MDLFSEFLEIISHHPSISYLELVNCAKLRGWNLDTTDLDESAAAILPAWKALATQRNLYSGRQSERTNGLTQIIPTGEIRIMEDPLAPELVENFKFLFASRIDLIGSAPLPLGDFLDDRRLGLSQCLLDISRTILSQIYSDSTQEVQSYCYQRHSILMNRCLLRRTYCSSLDNSVTKNRNNQAWHQDTNQQFQGLPMLTIWIPLQNSAGILIPGLEIAQCHTDNFIHYFGDGVECLGNVFQAPEGSDIETLVPTVQAGGSVAFNGLTFHRTYTTPQMIGLRDALLIRISLESHSSFFPGDRSKDIFFDL